jgi:hypothetical protein
MKNTREEFSGGSNNVISLSFWPKMCTKNPRQLLSTAKTFMTAAGILIEIRRDKRLVKRLK